MNLFFYVILLFLVVLVIFEYIQDFICFVRVILFSWTIPGPHIKELIKNAKREKILGWLQELGSRYGSIFGIWFGKDLTVFFTSPEDIRTILSDNHLLHKSRNYTLLEPWLGKGLLTNGGLQWQQRRKLLTPAFHFSALSEFKQSMDDNCDILISRLDAMADGRQFDIYPYITLFAMDVICETAMGIKKNAQLKSDSQYVTAVQSICRVLHAQSFSFWNRFKFIYNRTQHAKDRAFALQVLHKETMKTINLRRQKLYEEKVKHMAEGQIVDVIGAKRRLAFLDILLIAQLKGANLTDVDIREEVDTFMFEGHDTTSSAIAFAIYLLSHNAIAQENAYNEAIQMEGREKEPMKYMEAVIKETLRLFPSVPFFSRHLTEDFKIRDLIIPKGANISVLAYLVHLNEEEYPDCQTFNPERFYEKSENSSNPFAFVGFSAGPRNCIGQKFAMLELKSSLSKLLRAFEFRPADNFSPKPLAELVMKSGNGIEVKIRKRTRN